MLCIYMLSFLYCNYSDLELLTYTVTVQSSLQQNVNLCLTFWKNVFQNGCIILHFHQYSLRVCSCSTDLPALLFTIIYFSHSDRSSAVSHAAFSLWLLWFSFCVLICNQYIFFGICFNSPWIPTGTQAISVPF